jgi:diacylglycerol O-acyltransferase / wax synthase
MHDELLAGEDAAWLHMESATNPMVVNAVVQLAERIELDAAIRIADRIGALPHFGARVVERRAGPPSWEPVTGFRAGDHVESIELDVARDAALREEIGLLVSTQLDARKPLWRMYLVDRPASGTTILFRVHHALADGFALLGVLASLCDGGAESIDVAPRRARGLRAGAVRGSLRTLAHLVASPKDSATALKRAPGNDKRVAWSAPIALAEVKAIARVTSSTINDVLVAVVTGALARHLERRGARVAELEIHAMVPVNLRRAGESVTVGNDFGLVILGLPIGVADPIARIHAVRAAMETIKATPEAGVAHGMLRVIGWAPKVVEKAAVSFFGRKTSLVLTNVPGPQKAVTLGAVRVERIMFWVPQASHMGLGISIFSYAGEITVGVIADALVVRDPDTLVSDLHAEMASLEACLRAEQRA